MATRDRELERLAQVLIEHLKNRTSVSFDALSEKLGTALLVDKGIEIVIGGRKITNPKQGEYSYNTDENIVVNVRGINDDVIEEVTNVGTGTITYTGFGLYVVNGVIIYNGLGTGGDSGSTYTGTATISVGNISAGTSFTDADLQEMMSALLEAYLEPAFSSFSLQGISTLEIGDSITGNRTFSWTSSQPQNANDAVLIRDVTGGNAVIQSGLPKSGSYVNDFSLAPITKTTPNTSHTFRVENTDTQAGSYSKNYSPVWRARFYWGKNANTTINETEVKALNNNQLRSSVAGSYSFSTGDGYVYICCVSNFTINSMESGGFNVPYSLVDTINGFTMNGVSVNMRIYRTDNILNGAVTINVG
jgi:hypothetical protein